MCLWIGAQNDYDEYKKKKKTIYDYTFGMDMKLKECKDHIYVIYTCVYLYSYQQRAIAVYMDENIGVQINQRKKNNNTKSKRRREKQQQTE